MIFPGINLTRGYPIDIKPPPLRSVISRKRTKRRCRAGSTTGFDAIGDVGGQQPGFVGAAGIIQDMDVCENGVYTQISYFNILEWEI